MSKRDSAIAAAITVAFIFLTVGGFLVPASWQPLHHWIITFFTWPTGSVWSNMVAWVICGGLAFFGTHKVLARHHRMQMMKLEEIHEHIRRTHPLP